MRKVSATTQILRNRYLWVVILVHYVLFQNSPGEFYIIKIMKVKKNKVDFLTLPVFIKKWLDNNMFKYILFIIMSIK